eukprot:TRINITY_DN28121_c0_g1_i1.p1 TRINITY_DN28121_c0_g1~~TRINITY_DN28121_c0_g1_i1.p1  ORF type:complete len:347 (-),score=49.38 TRINITY_DN28121_c0_g1_i1:62-1102(-)
MPPAFFALLTGVMSSYSLSASPVIDSHIHVWSSTYGKFDTEPPAALDDSVASFAAYSAIMEAHGVNATVIVQPILYKFDHVPITTVLLANPDVSRGILLADPSVGQSAAVAALDAVVKTAPELWRGVRFNPALWEDSKFDDDVGRALFKRCAELGLVATFMFFGGIGGDNERRLRELIRFCPQTLVVIDHMGFVREDPQLAPVEEGIAMRDNSVAALLGLAELPQVHVKLSALFRVCPRPDFGATSIFQARGETAKEGVGEEEALALRVLRAYGSSRVMFGSDFPFVALEQNGGFSRSIETVREWLATLGGDSGLDATKASKDVMGATAYRLFFQPYTAENKQEEL